jgi:hypothetical protein
MTDNIPAAARPEGRLQQIAQRHLKAFGNSRVGIKLPYEDERRNREPLKDMIDRNIAGVEGGEEIAQKIVDDCVANAIQYEDLRRAHPNDPTHADIEAAMIETGRLYRLWETTFSLPSIELKHRVDKARGRGLSSGHSAISSEFDSENVDDQYTMSGGRSGLTAPPEGSDASQEQSKLLGSVLQDFALDRLRFDLWLTHWISHQSDQTELRWLPKYMQDYHTPFGTTTKALVEGYPLDQQSDLDQTKAAVRIRVMAAYSRYKLSLQEALAASLADTSGTLSIDMSVGTQARSDMTTSKEPTGGNTTIDWTDQQTGESSKGGKRG